MGLFYDNRLNARAVQSLLALLLCVEVCTHVLARVYFSLRVFASPSLPFPSLPFPFFPSHAKACSYCTSSAQAIVLVE